MGTTKRVFISYSHDSDPHRERVLALSERLRADGIDTILDRYVNGTPEQGWPRWMLDGLDAADRVLLICTPTYYRRFRGHEEPGKGKGVDWEGAIITQELYDARSRTTRFIPVVFGRGDQSQVPEPVRGQTLYCLTDEAAYAALYDALLGQAGVEPGALGTLKPRPRTLGEPLSLEPGPKAAAVPAPGPLDLEIEIARGGGPAAAGLDPDVGPGSGLGDILGGLMGGIVLGPTGAGGGRPNWGPLAAALKGLLRWPAWGRRKLIETAIRLDVAHPREAIVGQPFDLAVAVRRPDSPALVVADFPTTGSARGRVFHAEDRACVRYRIAIQSPPDCIVEPPDWVVPLRPGEDAEPVFFRVVSHGDGPRSFFVVAYQEDRSVAAQTRIQIPVKVRVAAAGPAVDSARPPPRQDPPPVPGSLRPPAEPPVPPTPEAQTMALSRLPAERLGLLPIAACRDPGRRLDLILVHGLGGDAFTTWMADPDRIETFWPNWLARDHPDLGIWTLGYAADSSGWKAESMALADRGTQVLDLLANEGLGDRPLVFVTHSLGGIVAKQLLRHAASFPVPRWRRIADRTRGIAFIATPHSGANLASFAAFASAVVRTNEQLKDLASHDARLRELHNWFRGYYAQQGLVCRTWCERREVRPEIPWLGLKLPKGLIVVDETSAEPGLPGEVAVPLDEDHISICKPASPSAQIYRSLLRWLDDCTQSAATRPPAPDETAAPPPAAPTDQPAGTRPPAGGPPGPAAARTLVYISYSSRDPRDVHWHDRLREVLDADPAIRDLVWDDTKCGPAEWLSEIRAQFARARVLIMLGSPDYFAPDSGARALEIEPGIEAQRRGELSILWLRVRDCDWDQVPVRHIMAATGPRAVPLEDMAPEDQEAALRRVRDQVAQVLGLPAAPPAGRVPATDPQPDSALGLWREKLEYLLSQEAVAADPAQKFQLRKLIEECRAKIRELGGEA